MSALVEGYYWVTIRYRDDPDPPEPEIVERVTLGEGWFSWQRCGSDIYVYCPEDEEELEVVVLSGPLEPPPTIERKGR